MAGIAAARVFVQEVEGRTQGLKFRIYPNSSLKIKPTELFSALQSNALEMAVYPLTYASFRSPAPPGSSPISMPRTR
jgi:TRAP-type transport system periplasmic protein